MKNAARAPEGESDFRRRPCAESPTASNSGTIGRPENLMAVEAVDDRALATHELDAVDEAVAVLPQ